MRNEISGRIVKAVLEYMRNQHASELPRLLEGLPELAAMDERQWLSYQTVNLLFQRAEETLGADRILQRIGCVFFRNEIRAAAPFFTPTRSGFPKAVRFFSERFRLWDAVSEIQILRLEPNFAELEHRMLSGFICTPGYCRFLEGCLGAVMAEPSPGVDIQETHCAVPIWEKYRQDPVEQGNPPESGAGFQADGGFRLGDKIYGATACRYLLHWPGRSGWRQRTRTWVQAFLAPARMRQELLRKDRLIEQQRWQIRQAEELLRELFREKRELVQAHARNLSRQSVELEAMALKIREWDGMKYYMLSITSHELRTPLTIIKGALHLIQTEGRQLGPERTQKYLDMAERNTGRLIRLLNDIMDFSRLEFGHLKLELGPVDIVRLIREMIEEFRDEAKNCQLALSSRITAEVPVLIGDQGRVKQILNNLMSNALKFTPAGGQIRIEMQPVGEFVEIVFQDSGIGISPRDRDKIFVKFQQIEASLSREAGGVGLGLAIVRELLLLHDGRIWVESEKGKGSRFIIRLPLAGPLEPEKVAKAKKNMEEGRPPLVLGNASRNAEDPSNRR
jgi:signal transduction histidine kinase